MGALTNKPYAFHFRPWESRSIVTTDFLDAFCASIRVNVRSNQILRLLPRPSRFRNDIWINDKTRFFIDGLTRQRLGTPLIKFDGEFITCSWEYGLTRLQSWVWVASIRFHGVAGRSLTWPELVLFKDYLNKSRASFLISESVMPNTDNIMQPSFKNFPRDDLPNHAVILLNSNLELEYPLLNMRLDKLKKKGIPVFSLGFRNSSFIEHLGPISELFNIIKGKSDLCQVFLEYKNITFLVGQSVVTDAMLPPYLLNKFLQYLINQNLNIYLGYLPQTFTGMPSTFLHYTHKLPFTSRRPKLLYLLEADTYKFDPKEYNFVVYHGSHGDKAAPVANLILPAEIISEASNHYSFSIDGSLVYFQKLTTSMEGVRPILQVLLKLRKNSAYKRPHLIKLDVARLFSNKTIIDHPFTKFKKPIWGSQLITSSLHRDPITRASIPLALVKSRDLKDAIVRGNFDETEF